MKCNAMQTSLLKISQLATSCRLTHRLRNFSVNFWGIPNIVANQLKAKGSRVELEGSSAVAERLAGSAKTVAKIGETDGAKDREIGTLEAGGSREMALILHRD